jgi:hypothetical protein
MRVEECFIIMIDPGDEVTTGANALFDKYKATCGAVGTFSVVRGINALPVIMNRKAGNLRFGASVNDFLTMDEDSPAESKLTTKRPGAGAYLLFHNRREKAGDATRGNANALADILRSTIADPARLAKLVLLACMAAPQTDRPVGKTVEEIGKGGKALTGSVQRSVLLSLTMELDKHDIRPMIAGWDVFVSVLPHRPGVGDIYSSSDPQQGHALTSQEIEGRSGTKFVADDSRYYQPSDEERAALKRVFWVDESRKVTVCDEIQWSDRYL